MSNPSHTLRILTTLAHHQGSAGYGLLRVYTGLPIKAVLEASNEFIAHEIAHEHDAAIYLDPGATLVAEYLGQHSDNKILAMLGKHIWCNHPEWFVEDRRRRLGWHYPAAVRCLLMLEMVGSEPGQVAGWEYVGGAMGPLEAKAEARGDD